MGRLRGYVVAGVAGVLLLGATACSYSPAEKAGADRPATAHTAVGAAGQPKMRQTACTSALFLTRMANARATVGLPPLGDGPEVVLKPYERDTGFVNITHALMYEADYQVDRAFTKEPVLLQMEQDDLVAFVATWNERDMVSCQSAVTAADRASAPAPAPSPSPTAVPEPSLGDPQPCLDSFEPVVEALNAGEIDAETAALASPDERAGSLLRDSAGRTVKKVLGSYCAQHPELRARTRASSVPRGAEACGVDSGYRVYAKAGTTSCAFALEVSTAWMSASGRADRVSVRATSPATGSTYTLTCVTEGTVATCRGGRGAAVFIEGP